MPTFEVASDIECLELLGSQNLARDYFDKSPDPFISSRKRSDEHGGVLLDFWWLQSGYVSFENNGSVLALHYRADENGGLVENGGLYVVEGAFLIHSTGEKKIRRAVPNLNADRRSYSVPPVLMMSKAILLEEVHFEGSRDTGGALIAAERDDTYPDYDFKKSELGFALLPLVVRHDPQKSGVIGPNIVLHNSRKDAGLTVVENLATLGPQANRDVLNTSDLTSAQRPFVKLS